MSDMLCTACGEVAAARACACARCGSRDLLPADAPAARRYLDARAARRAAQAAAGSEAGSKADDGAGEASARAQATGKVLGRALGRLLGK